MTDDPCTLSLVLIQARIQESLKASSTSVLIGKKRKEATATETRAYQKQFHESKLLECKSWLGNEVFDLVDTCKIHVRNWVTGRWVLNLKRDKDGNFLKTKARWVLRGFQDKQNKPIACFVRGGPSARVELLVRHISTRMLLRNQEPLH